MLSLRFQVRCPPPPRRRPPRYILATSICEFRPHANGALLRAAGDATHGCGTPSIPPPRPHICRSSRESGGGLHNSSGGCDIGVLMTNPATETVRVSWTSL